MRLASVRTQDGDAVAVDAGEGRVAPLARVIELAGATLETPRSMLQLIAAGSAFARSLGDALNAVDARSLAAVAVDPVAWYPPVRTPGKVLAVAMNNAASNARKISAPDHPAYFLKPPSCLIGHGEPVRIRPYYGSVHPEPELAVVIGRPMKDTAARDALSHVFGYTIFDDITGNGMRAEDMFHYWAIYARPDNPDETQRVEQHLSYAARYKGTDTFGVLGPWLVTRDEIADPDDLAVACAVGGEPVADDNTRYYNYKVAEVLSFISHFQTLAPGDVVSLGTAFRPGSTRKSIHHANLQRVPGPIEISIAGLGTQSSPVIVDEVRLGDWRL
jgi:2-keto-4-pentenoate hydratase/2-oxohepta-3-ene-1,7-dioic acid hydratase in catechol pathway